ncbi:centrosomal protein of 68 kDa isoform X1 [Thunnus maccoyii]|uniref:centrosomal protein of 68 kDa isoform X1 n=1 Tax=Thunnus maccoyii TaxID=8240 RepID=UPI001C4D49F8|nr:centrosomal protein of 68 kDa isoform X1 [Thunnus maccoyii]XP_042289533.1 centrosomal protein of 68 kDa isoform X1 [Thunnus maccoyii]XP_042289534.1 centrosomal protein of 68 kDa isoform X1 [Thunnus maccoyii]
METKGCSQRWKMRLPEFKDSRGKDTERGKTEKERNGAGPQKSVTMAPTSRYLSDRQYVMRKPLFSVEQHTSILKKTHPLKHPQKEKHLSVSRTEDQQYANISLLTSAREELTPESFSFSHCDLSSPSASREELCSPLGVSDLRGRLSHEEHTVGSPFPGCKSAQRSLSSSFLEVQRLNPPLRPPLTSTVLYPTYTPRSGYSRRGQTELRLGGREGRGGGETKLNTCSFVGQSRGRTMSSCQANYWACAIPKALPPSPDRHSVGWDPNREYQALLDYTYPLRPGHLVSEWDRSELRRDSLLQPDPNLQDSGIELDHLCSSTNLSGLDFSLSGTGQIREGGTLSVGQRSPDLQGFSKSSDGSPSGAPLPLTHPASLSLESMDCCRDRGEMNSYRSGGHHHEHHTPSSSTSTAFIRSTSVLPRSRRVGVEVDEEFRPLPEQLEELQLLSRQVREVTAQLRRPITASWESLDPGTTSILSSITLPEKQEAEEEEEGVKEQEGKQDTDEGHREESSAAETAADDGDSEAVRRSPGAWMESVGGGLTRASLREVEALAEQLCGLTLPDTQRSSQEDQEQSDSLMRHIQIFCSHLGQLIQWLYTVSEKMDLMAPPTVDIDSVKSSLADYQSFQKEVSNHQPLTSCVLHSGQLLLSCINTTSPVLRDTLLLIERQSRALESHTEHFFSSILSAMDSLTQPSQPSRVEAPGPVGLQGSTL